MLGAPEKVAYNFKTLVITTGFELSKKRSEKTKIKQINNLPFKA